MQKETTMACFKVLSWNFCAVAEEKHEEPSSGK
jgi:hypothetical protein